MNGQKENEAYWVRSNLKWLLGLLFGLLLAASMNAKGNEYCSEPMSPKALNALRPPVSHLFDQEYIKGLGIRLPETNIYLALAIGEVDRAQARFLNSICPDPKYVEHLRGQEAALEQMATMKEYYPIEQLGEDRELAESFMRLSQRYSSMLVSIPHLLKEDSCKVEAEKLGCRGEQAAICFVEKIPAISKSTSCGQKMQERGFYELFENPRSLTPLGGGSEAGRSTQEN